jgi:hypothetical protein
MKKSFNKMVLAFLFFLIACDNNSDRAMALDTEEVFRKQIEKVGLETFKMPDSIDLKLLIAAYEDTVLHQRHLLLFDNAGSRKAQNITFVSGDSVTIDHLQLVEYNTFRSDKLNMDYIVREKTVAKVLAHVNCSNVTPTHFFGTEYSRIDTVRLASEASDSIDFIRVK